MRGVVLQKASKTSLLQAEARPPRDARPHRPPPPCPQVMHRLSTGLSTAYPQARTYHKRVAHAHRLWVAGYTCASNAGQRKSGAAGAYASPAHTHALGAAGACAPRSHHPRTHPRTPTHTHRPDTGTHTGTTHSTHTHTRAVGRCLVIFHKHGIIGCRSRQRGVMCQTYSAGHGAL